MVSVIDQDLRRCLASIKDSKPVLELTYVDSRAHIATIASSSFGSSLDQFVLEMKINEKTLVYLVFV